MWCRWLGKWVKDDDRGGASRKFTIIVESDVTDTTMLFKNTQSNSLLMCVFFYLIWFYMTVAL